MQNITVSDDEGFMILFDPDAYASYIDGEALFDETIEHLRSEMSTKHLLMWGTGWGGHWQVKIEVTLRGVPDDVLGFREAIGPISVSKGRLCLLDFMNVSIAAMNSNTVLPGPKYLSKIITLPPGDYICRVVQLQDPGGLPEDGDSDADFGLQLYRDDRAAPPWSSFPWTDNTIEG